MVQNGFFPMLTETREPAVLFSIPRSLTSLENGPLRLTPMKRWR
jgi:hypothetical protein